MGQPRQLQDFYIYSTTVTALAAGATATNTINIQADAAFRWEKSTFFADIAAAAVVHGTRIIPLCTVLVTDTGSGRQLMDSAIPIPNIFGSGEIPFILQQPKIFSPRSTLSLIFTNYDAAVTYNIRLSLIGSKLFQMAG